MNVLFVSADLPWPPDGGGRIATLRVLESVASGRDVDLIALADPYEPPDIRHLLDICRTVSVIEHPFTFGRHRARQAAVAARSIVSGRPYRLEKFRSSRFQAAIHDATATRAYDLVHYDQFGTAL